MTIDDIARLLSRRQLLAAGVALGILPPAALAKDGKHKHHGKKHDGKKHHHRKELPPVDDITDPVVVEPDPEVTPAAKAKPKKHRKHKHHASERKAAAASVLAAPDGVLLARYDGKAADNTVPRTPIRYLPRQFKNGLAVPDVSWGPWTIQDHGSYSGWDIFPMPNNGGTRASNDPKLASFTLNRSATVALVWRSETTPPTWVTGGGWVQSGTVRAYNPTKAWTRTYPVYRKQMNAGQFWLGGNYDAGASTAAGAKNLYWVLFAESNGSPSSAPSVPAGQSTPNPNQTCPNWLHDTYVTTGPDGKRYPTWHPSIDPTHWCYYRHEHGTDPALIDPNFNPAYGYVAAQGGMSENHWGHKTHGYQNADGYWVLSTQHVGTTGVARADTCKQRFHLVELSLYDASKTLLAHLHLMADYGRSLVSVESPLIEYTPTACPNGNRDTGYTTSVPVRKIPSAANGGGQVGYEPWQFVQTGYEAIGLKGAQTVNTQQPLDICPDVVCDTPYARPNNAGTSRILQPTTTFAIVDPKVSADGKFCSDAMGKQIVSCSTAGAVPQYVKPGLNVAIKGTGSTSQTHFETRNWGDLLVVSAGGSLDMDLDGQITETHGPN